MLNFDLLNPCSEFRRMGAAWRLRKRLQEPEETPDCQDREENRACSSQYDQRFKWFSFLGRFAWGVAVSQPMRLVGMSRAEARSFTDRPLAASSGLRLAIACAHVSPSCYSHPYEACATSDSSMVVNSGHRAARSFIESPALCNFESQAEPSHNAGVTHDDSTGRHRARLQG